MEPPGSVLFNFKEIDIVVTVRVIRSYWTDYQLLNTYLFLHVQTELQYK